MIIKSFIPTLLSIQKIWGRAIHSSMTDLIRYRDKWFCTFRESSAHVGGSNGVIRVIVSKEGLLWKTAALLAQEGIDLRDPKLSITPAGELMLLVGGLKFDNTKKLLAISSQCALSEDGCHWSPFKEILSNNEWLWRITWHKGKAYGVSYSLSDIDDRSREWNVKLFESLDGLNFTLVTTWDIYGHPSETTLRFLPSGKMVALVRRGMKLDNFAWIGLSDPPYIEWHWHPTQHHVGGPNFLIDSGQQMWASGRLLLTNPYIFTEKTFIGRMDYQDVFPLILLPSGGDCSYPGMYYYEGILWMSYYSSHEGKASIYLARLAI